MARRFKIYNGPMPTTASQVAVTTGTSIKTLLQVAIKSGVPAHIVNWGISYDGSAAATPGVAELCETDVAATVTASAEADVTKLDDTSILFATAVGTLGTAATGYTSTAEGSITVIRQFDALLLPPTGPFYLQIPLGQEYELKGGNFLRVRVKFGTAINAICWVTIEA